MLLSNRFIIVYAKAERRDSTWEYLTFSEHIVPKEGYKKFSGSWFGRNKTKWIKVSQAELNKILPKDHPDKEDLIINYEIY